MSFEAATVNVVGQPYQAIGQLPVLEVPSTHLPHGPMQGDLSIAMNLLSTVTPHALPVFTDANGRLPEILQWVLNTIWHGYTIQFRKGSPHFSEIVHPWEVSALSQEILSLLEKGAIEEIPPT